MVKTLVALALLAAAVAGCPRPAAKLENVQNRLLRRVAGYHEAMGWHDWAAAGKFVAPQSRMEFEELTHRLERGYTLDSWVVRDLKLGESGDKAEVVVYRTYLMPPSVTLQSENIILAWVLIKNEWYLAGPPF